ENMQNIAHAVQEGANAYLTRQFRTLAVFAGVAFVALLALPADTLGVRIGRSAFFVVGAGFSAAIGYLGMSLAVQSNLRVAAAANTVGRDPAMKIGFRTGAFVGMATVGLGLLGASVVVLLYKDEAPSVLEGFGFGAALLAMFMRVGGGIFTTAADVGADLVGKVEAGIPEDDPRYPAVIADNVGDNVGDCAGMAADLFETYAVTAVAVMLLGVLTFSDQTAVALYPLVLGGVAIIASIIGTFAVRSRAGNVERALYQGLIVSGAIAAVAFYPVTKWLMDGITFKGGGSGPGVGDLYLCSLVGIAVTALLFLITDYYTSTRFSPVKKTAAASQTGHATNIISGLAQGLQATALPALVLVLGLLASWKLAGGGTHGIYGIGVAVMGQLSLTGLIVALDAFGPITDNAGGIAEMANLPEDVRNVTDPLDAVGNTTKAVTKGYAIGSAVLAAVVLFAGFKAELAAAGQHVLFAVDDPPVLMGLLLGGMMVCLFAALSMEAVGRAGGAVVEEVRRQFREKPGIMEGTEQPDYATCVDLVTKSAQREMIIPSLIPIIIPFIVGLIDVKALGGLLIGVIVVGFFFAVLMTAGGGAWDNAKKLIEDGAFGGKGSEAHAASVTGDTVGDPFKDTAGPAINPMIKVANIVAILIIPVIT
ncbi:MAG: V-type H(+)-translocating pyrophosphatase, partial [Solirubrobacterales bacterium]|nr:V-type H(+)-translocating pyrophosphatase [Solirubrobacterales bacterium]